MFCAGLQKGYIKSTTTMPTQRTAIGKMVTAARFQPLKRSPKFEADYFSRHASHEP
jgi:hypothetical protein